MSRSWARVNVRGAFAILRESASLATQVAGETISSDKPRVPCNDDAHAGWRRPWNDALECAPASRRAGNSDARGVRQYRGPPRCAQAATG
jgi:hypothetical protein